jgi:hypothetical protein
MTVYLTTNTATWVLTRHRCSGERDNLRRNNTIRFQSWVGWRCP